MSIARTVTFISIITKDAKGTYTGEISRVHGSIVSSGELKDIFNYHEHLLDRVLAHGSPVEPTDSIETIEMECSSRNWCRGDDFLVHKMNRDVFISQWFEDATEESAKAVFFSAWKKLYPEDDPNWMELTIIKHVDSFYVYKKEDNDDFGNDRHHVVIYDDSSVEFRDEDEKIKEVVRL